MLSKLLLDDISANKVHMTTGIIGVKALFPALSSIQRQDVAMDIAEQSDYPSWGYMAFNSIEPASAVSLSEFGSPLNILMSCSTGLGAA